MLYPNAQKKINIEKIVEIFQLSFPKKFACAQKVGFPRSGHKYGVSEQLCKFPEEVESVALFTISIKKQKTNRKQVLLYVIV